MASAETLRGSWLRIVASFPIMGRDPQDVIAARAQMFAELMRDLPDDAVAGSVMQICAESQSDYPPSLGAIRNKAISLIQRATGDDQPDAAEAWRQLKTYLVSDSIHGSGVWRVAPNTIHPLIVTAAERFGTTRFVGRQAEDEPTDFAQFRGIYNQLENRDLERRRTLPAVHEHMAALAQSLRMDTPRLGKGNNNHEN